MKATDVFPSTFLKKEDVGKGLTLTIETVSMEDVNTDDGKEKKAVLHFVDGRAKPMILNRGNWSILEEAYGVDSDDWAGHPVEVYVDPSVMFGGKRVGGVRVRTPEKKPAGPAAWTLDQALALAGQAGITKEEMLAHLRSQGLNAWNGEKCSPLVRAMIEEKMSVPF
jgi:hypothetical protein